MILLYEDHPVLKEAFNPSGENPDYGVFVLNGRGWWLRDSDPLPEDWTECWEIRDSMRLYGLLREHYPEALI